MGIFGFIKSIFNREDNDIEKNKNIENIQYDIGNDCEKLDLEEEESEFNLKYEKEENDSIIQAANEGEVSGGVKNDLDEKRANFRSFLFFRYIFFVGFHHFINGIH